MRLKLLFFITVIFNSYVFSQDTNHSEKIIEDILGKTIVKEQVDLTIEMVLQSEKNTTGFIFEEEYFTTLGNEIKKYTNDSLYFPIYLELTEKYSTSELEIILKKINNNNTDGLVKEFNNLIIDTFLQIADNWFKWVTEIGTHKSFAKIKKNVNKDLCQKFKIGKFQYTLPNNTLIEIERIDDFHLESKRGDVAKMEIIWTEPCNYDLKLIECDNPETYNYYKDVVFSSEIIYINKDKALVFVKENGILTNKIKFTKTK